MSGGRYPNIKKYELDGIKFASGQERNRYLVLKDMAARGKILFSAVEGDGVHPHFDFVVNGCAVGRGYKADFRYHVPPAQRMGLTESVVEEVKGPIADDWPLRRDLFLALYPQYTLLINGKEAKRRAAK
jgi:hypothetical protein